MINLPVDEAYAYDYLAILEVKVLNNVCDAEILKACSNAIRKQVGDDMHMHIVESDFYQDCIRVNRLTFEAVDGAKNDTVKASVVHNLNYDRYLAKTRLQNEFFPKSVMTEKKN